MRNSTNTASRDLRSIPGLGANAAKVFIMALILSCNCFQGFSTAWTTATAGNVNSLANWTNGSSAPTTFATPGDTWTVTLAMTLPSAAVWTLGSAASAPDTLTLATGGTIGVGGIPTTPIINVYGVFLINGGTLSMGGTAASEIVNVYGSMIMTAGTITTPASSAHLYINTGTFTMSGGTANSTGSGASITYNTTSNFFMTGGTIGTSAAGAYDTVNVHGTLSLTGGSFAAGGASCKMITHCYGNFTASGTGTMTNTGAGCTNSLHFCLPSASGTMMIDNTSTGTWSGTNVFVDTGCTAQLDGNFSTTTGSATYGFTVNGTLICPAAYVVNGTRFFTLNGIATLKVAHATGINGAIVTSGTKTFTNTANYEFNGTAAQVTGTDLPASLADPDTITINNTAGVTLTQSTVTNGKLALTSGILNTGAFTMSVPGTAASVYGAGATSYVNGTLVKTITALTTVNFEVGDLSYAPMLLTLSAAGTAGSFGLKVTNGMHPNVATSGFSTTHMANHYWTITNLSAAGPATVIPKGTYNLADIIGGSNAFYRTQEYTGSAWLGAPLISTSTTAPYTTAPNAGIALATLAGDYIFGRLSGPTLNVHSVSNNPELTIFPNPNTGIFTLNIPADDNHDVSVVITDILGRKVKKFTASTNELIEVKLDQAKGIYFITATDVYGRYSGKMVVE